MATGISLRAAACCQLRGNASERGTGRRFWAFARDSTQVVGTLSGGNQQKVVLARWLEAGTRVLVLAEPTRGVDVGARADIYAVLETLRAQGLALVMVSSDIEETLSLCDRTLVFRQGRVVREFARQGLTQESLLAAASGEQE